MFAIAIVFAVVIFLILAIGLIFLRFSDVFLVFSIVAFMVLVVFAVSSVILRKARKRMGNVINYDKNLFDINDIFVDSTWESQMISEMVYHRVALAYAHPENTKKIFGDRPFDFDKYINKWRGRTEDLIYLLVEKLNGIQGIPVTDKAFQGLKKRVRIRGAQNVTPELEKYASMVIGKYKRYLEKSKNIDLLYSMINIETGELKRLMRSDELYPLTWFYRTPHEKLKTILEKSWSEEERNRQIYVVLYAFISKFVNKKIRTSTGEERFILNLRQNDINLIPPLGDAATKRDFYEAIQRAYRKNYINLNLSLMPRLEDVKKYYTFYVRTQQVSMLQVRELIELYTVIARHIYENKEGFLVYDIIMNNGQPDLIYLPLFMFESFPNIINVERGLVVTEEKEITVVIRNLENVLGMRRKLNEDILNRRLLPVILCCVFINLKFEDFMRFMKALFVVLSYIFVGQDISNLNIFSELFHFEDRFKKQDIRFRAAIFSYVYFLLFGRGQSLKGFPGKLSTEMLEEMKRLSPKSIKRIKVPDLTNFNAVAGSVSDFVFNCYRYIFELLLCKNTYHRDMVTGRYLLNTREFVRQMEEFSPVI